jgi:hypothetical protein
MGFNKRIFSKEMLLEHHLWDRENGIKNAIGKTDGFIFADKISHQVIDLWMSDEKEKARKILDNVSRVTA